MTNIEQGLEIIDSTIQNFQREKIKKERLNEEKKKIAKSEKDKLIGIENSLLPEKDKFYNGILKWRNNFIKTEQFKHIFNIKDDIFMLDQGVIIFHGGWGHEIPYKTKYGCWSELFLNKSGELNYRAGYKFVPSTIPRFNLERDINHFSLVYLQEIYNSIKNNTIYNTIKSDLEERLRLIVSFTL